MSIKQLIPAELIETDAHGNSFTTSLKVAAYFGKKHLHVLRDIALRIAIITAVSGDGNVSKSGCIKEEGLSKSGLSPDGAILRRQARLPGYSLAVFLSKTGAARQFLTVFFFYPIVFTRGRICKTGARRRFRRCCYFCVRQRITLLLLPPTRVPYPFPDNLIIRIRSD